MRPSTAVTLGIDHMDTEQFYGNGFVNQILREGPDPKARAEARSTS